MQTHAIACGAIRRRVRTVHPAVDKPAAAVAGQAFNFGAERPLAVLEVVHLLLGQLGKTHLEPRILNEATHEIRHQYLSAEKARRTLGWEPLFTLDAGLRRTIDWYAELLASGR